MKNMNFTEGTMRSLKRGLIFAGGLLASAIVSRALTKKSFDEEDYEEHCEVEVEVYEDTDENEE